MNITLVKILKYSIYLILGISILYLIYFINTEDPLKKKLRRELKSIYKNNTFSKHLLNDYREEFLPNTQFIKLEYKKIDLDFLNINPCYFGSCYTFFLEQKDDKLIILDRKGNLKITSIDDLDKNSIQFTDVKTNLNFDYVLDVLIKGNEIFITGKKDLDENQTILEIVSGYFDEKEVDFTSVMKFRAESCILRHSVHSGKIQFMPNSENKLILAVNSAGGLDSPNLENLSKDSICGKTLLVDIKKKSYEIYSSGHRNIIGLYADEKVILSTEHGPHAGDEINNIKANKSYGWPIASYGEKYTRDKNNLQPNYKKNHKKEGFEEPIFSFIPAIGISEIIKLPNNFSNLWQDNFLLASLNGKHLFRIKFDEDFNKIIYFEKIYIGDRMRDLIYVSNKKKIILALELEGALGILSNAN
tara:strand:- start:25 stop:1272 length:1248 start_codon:yes stop_codon:yes gene_type:complete